jgi:hypothetical protein
LAPQMHVGPCVPVETQLERAGVGQVSGPTWSGSHLLRMVGDGVVPAQPAVHGVRALAAEGQEVVRRGRLAEGGDVIRAPPCVFP